MLSPVRVFAILLLALVLAGARAARAQEGDPLREVYERGMALFEAGRYEEAVPHFERALSIAEERLGPDDPELATDLVNLGEVYRLVGRLDDAERLFRRALELDRRRAATHPERLAVTLNDLGLLLRMRGRLEEAERLYRESLALLEKAYGPRHPDVAKVLSNLAHVELARGRPERALALLHRARDIVGASLPADHPTRRAIEANLERARSELARARIRQAAAVRPAAGSGPSPGPHPAERTGAAPARAAGEVAPVAAGAAARTPGPAFAVHLGSFSSRDRARRAAAVLRARHRAVLADAEVLEPAAVDLPGKGRFWRALFGPYGSRAEAEAVCRRIRARGAWCAVVEAATGGRGPRRLPAQQHRAPGEAAADPR